jgi:hypothetical protein
MLLPLPQRHLRLSLDGPFTEYRWFETICVKRFLGLCINHNNIEHIEKDFDFTNPEDRAKFNSMNFDCSVRERP